jgi:hypothetical protein
MKLKIGCYYHTDKSEIYIKVCWCREEPNGDWRVNLNIYDKKSGFLYERNKRYTIKKYWVDTYKMFRR